MRAGMVSTGETRGVIIMPSPILTLPDNFNLGDFSAELSEDLSISSNILSANLAYRVLPFLEINARVGLASSEASTGLKLTGTPSGPFSDFFNGPVTFDTAYDTETSGYSLGVGANAYFPVYRIGSSAIAGYTGFQYNWNRFESSAVVSQASRASFGLAYPLDLSGGNQTVYRVGSSYNWLTREVSQTQTFNGQPINVQLVQEFSNPWSIDAGASFPLSHNLSLGLSATHQLSGETSAFGSIVFRFE